MYRLTGLVCLCLLAPVTARGQTQTTQPHDHAAHDAATGSAWMLMYDGVLFGAFNHQAGPRGGDDFVATNWVMGMASRSLGPGRLSLSGMVSADAATAGKRGYRELFQIGEAYKGEPLVDRQHPHDFVMQLAAWWRVPVGSAYLTLSGAAVGEPALGPVAFMHRPSAAENFVAPLNHHRLDSTHIAMGVVTGALERGAWTIESSAFRGREPDDNRWDVMDPGGLDSWAARVWFRPSSTWELQASHGFLNEPEELALIDVRRSTASASWFSKRDDGFTAATVAFGRNDEDHGATSGVLAEATRASGPYSIYGRWETLQLDTTLLDGGHAEFTLDDPSPIVTAVTFGGVRELRRWYGLEAGIGADLTAYRVPSGLRVAYGQRPISFHLFFRLRPPAGSMGRMWNMRMGRTH
jgi:hypothetical protein